MLKYLIQDFVRALRYFPYGIFAAVILFACFSMINAGRVKNGKAAKPIMASVCFYTYLLIIFCLTLLSREGGGESRIDLVLGSTLQINTRNNAYIVENIMLFIPYGFCLGWKRGYGGRFVTNLVLGLFTTIAVECTQLVTGRGIFQLDDILTNTLGCAIGLILLIPVIKLFDRKEKSA